MRIKSLLTLVIILLLIDYSFSGTCYRSESYCAEYGTKQECHDEPYQGTCDGTKRVNKPVSGWCPKTTCETHTIYDKCDSNCMGSRYKNCCCNLWCGRRSCCDTETYVYSCQINCNPHSKITCTTVAENCMIDNWVNEPYTYPCTLKKPVCNWVEDTSNCVRTSIKQVPYECSDAANIPLVSVSKSSNSITIQTSYGINFDGQVQLYYDLIDGTIPNCQKLTCGKPTIDNECNRGCLTSQIESKYSYFGSNTLSKTINISQDKTYNLLVGVWKNGNYLTHYNYGNVRIDSVTNINDILVSRNENVITITTKYSSNYVSPVEIYYDLVEGSFPNCQKFSCGLPSIDKDCNKSCLTSAISTQTTNVGPNVAIKIITIPYDKSYTLTVGVWKNGERKAVKTYSNKILVDSPRTTINNVIVSKTDEAITIKTDYFTNYDSNIKIYYDLIEGVMPNCEKLTCGEKSTDTQCNHGCLRNEILTQSVKAGINTAIKIINIPQDKNYKLIIGIWRNGQFHVSREYGNVIINSVTSIKTLTAAKDENNVIVNISGLFSTNYDSTIKLNYILKGPKTSYAGYSLNQNISYIAKKGNNYFSKLIQIPVDIDFQLSLGIWKDNQLKAVKNYGIVRINSKTIILNATLEKDIDKATITPTIKFSNNYISNAQLKYSLTNTPNYFYNFSAAKTNTFINNFNIKYNTNLYLKAEIIKDGIVKASYNFGNIRINAPITNLKNVTVIPSSKAVTVKTFYETNYASRMKIIYEFYDYYNKLPYSSIKENITSKIGINLAQKAITLAKNRYYSLKIKVYKIGIDNKEYLKITYDYPSKFIIGQVLEPSIKSFNIIGEQLINNNLKLDFEILNCAYYNNLTITGCNSYSNKIARCKDSITFTPKQTGSCMLNVKINDAPTKTLKLLFIKNPINNVNGTNPFIPGNMNEEEFTNYIETGNYDAKIMELLLSGLTNQQIMNTLMISALGITGIITYKQSDKILKRIQKIRDLVYSNHDASNTINSIGKILGYAGIGLLSVGVISAFLGASVPISIIAGVAGIVGITGSALEYLSHQYAINIESKTELSKEVYLKEHSIQMTLDFAFLVIDAATLGQGSKFTKPLVEEAIERITKEAVSEFSEISIKEVSGELLERALKEAEEEFIEKTAKEALSPITNLLKQKLSKYVTEEALDNFTFKLSKQSDEIIEKITKILTDNPEMIKILGNSKMLHSLINILSAFPNKDLTKLISTILSNSLEFFKKTGKIPSFNWVNSIDGVSPCQFVFNEDGTELAIELAKNKVDDVIKYSDFLIQHELKHYEYQFVKKIDYAQKLLQYFDKETAEQINNILIDAQIDAELAAANPIIKEQIKEYEKEFYKEAAGNYLINDPLNFAKLFYDFKIGEVLDNSFKNAYEYIKLNEKYIEWYDLISEMIKK
ncbi:MAG: hypothetical protein PHN56_04775 [Candidatus Nanoarchaeia archaeon]|nr:hypothetical protein [Candidatus Nanoarchaeia archaeon]